MSRETQNFWNQQNAHIDSMYLRKNIEHFAKEEESELLGLLPPLKGQNMLELASGIGRFTRYFSNQVQHLTSVDFTPHFVEKNQRDNADCANVTWITSNALDLDVPAESFDFIFFNWLLMYLEDAETEILMKKLCLWLKPGGQLFFRESCAAQTARGTQSNYPVIYRSLAYYDTLIKKHFTLIREGHLQSFEKHFATPFQCYWLATKNCQILG